MDSAFAMHGEWKIASGENWQTTTTTHLYALIEFMILAQNMNKQKKNFSQNRVHNSNLNSSFYFQYPGDRHV